jgi:hypothetical protein
MQIFAQVAAQIIFYIKILVMYNAKLDILIIIIYVF